MIVQAGREAIKSVPSRAAANALGITLGKAADDEPPFLTGRGMSICALF
jgi:hypothetical protein